MPMSTFVRAQVPVDRVRPTPIIEPGQVSGYGPIFNAGLIYHEGVFHLFARGVRTGYRRNRSHRGPRFSRYISDILVFVSPDGVEYRFQKVLAAADGEPYAYEDPRIQQVHSPGRTRFVITYTHLPPPRSGLPWRVGLAELTYGEGEFHLLPGTRRVVGPEGLEDKDAVLFNLADWRLAFYHRLYPDIQLALFGSLEELLEAGPAFWDEHLRRLDEHTVLRPSHHAHQVGAGPPPLQTPAGPVLFLHQRSHLEVYANYAALLDEDTGRIRALLREPILSPQTPWERRGDVDQVVYVQGAHRTADGHIYLTYGAADRCVGAAMISEGPLLDALASSPPPGPSGAW